MTQFTNNAQDSETSSLYADIRRAELRDQRWNRNKSVDLAKREGISLNDEHWAVIVYLRSYYLEHGLPRFARTTARALKQQFSAAGWHTSICTSFLPVARLPKAAASPTCGCPQTPLTSLLAPAIDGRRPPGNPGQVRPG